MNPSGGSGGSGGGSKWVSAKPTVPPKTFLKSGTGTGGTGGSGPQSKWVKAKPSPGLAKKSIAPLNKATTPGQTPPTGVKPCPLKVHWVKATLHYKDDDSIVQATAGKILKGSEEVNAGPLGGGFLEARQLLDGSYEVTFPDIDEQEWDVA